MSEEAATTDPAALLRALPAVDEVLRGPEGESLLLQWPRERVVPAVRAAIDAARRAIREGRLAEASTDAGAIAREAGLALLRKDRPSHERALNGTGVVIHTGLGRAVLAPAAVEALTEAMAGYAIVEVDRESGERNRRETAVAELLCELTGAEAATVVNNNAAATMITLAALAAGREAVIARSQLIEIGGSFRLPDVFAQSGARMVEVGCTNKTHLRDYESALSEQTGALMRVHTSNYRIVGFTQEVSLDELVALGRRHDLPVIDDLGSGCLVDLGEVSDEPVVGDSVQRGASVVMFSGDKMLGGPQAGIIIGQRRFIEKIQRHPLYRVVRPGKLTLVALEATLRLYRDPRTVKQTVPVLAQLTADPAALRSRAQELSAKIDAVAAELSTEVIEGTSQVGGGALPTVELPTSLVSVALKGTSTTALSAMLRAGCPPLFTRIQGDRVLIDLRTILDGEEKDVVRVIDEALNTDAWA